MHGQRDTAIHEAGHAVMAARLGRTVGAVSIASAGDTLGGSLDDTDFRFSREDAEHWVVTSLAGLLGGGAVGPLLARITA